MSKISNMKKENITSGGDGEGGTDANGDNYGIFVGVFVLLLMAYDPISSFLFFLAVYMIHMLMYYFTRFYSKCQ